MTKGIPRGVEFAGGTVVITQFEQPVSVEQVRGAHADRRFRASRPSVQEYGDPCAAPGDGPRAAGGQRVRTGR